MKVFKKILAVLCSATLIVAAPVTAFASEPDPVAPTTGTSGAGNVLAYNFDTVVVPTTIKISFNPQGLDIAKRSNETAVKDQIVSLNYGIASKASQDKKVIVKFAANTTLSGESSDVVFVDEEAKITAQADPEDATDVGAPTGSHRILLQVAPATAVPTYYTAGEAAGTAFAVTGDRGSREDNITAERLSDVVMTAASTGVQTFATAATTPKNSAYAILGFKLDKATYEAKEDLTFETTASQVADKMEIKALGTTGVTGFTFTGKMNTNTDWTKANLSAIAITPIYELADAGTEAAVTGTTAGAIVLTEEDDLAEPAKPLSAAEIAAEAAATAAATAASGFKTTHAAVLTLDAESVTGSEEELAAIDAAIAAFGELSADAKAVLAAETTPITADTLAAIKELSEAAATPAVTTYALRLMTATGNLRYDFDSDSKPTGSVTAVTINGTNRPATVTSGNISYDATEGYFLVKNTVVNNADFGIAQGSTTIVATIGGTEYTFTY